MMRTLVVNYHYDEYDVLITRKTPFGNRNPISATQNRQQVIAKHFDDMQRKLRTEPNFHEMVMGLEGKRLGCVCKPVDCHGDLYVEYIKAVRAVEVATPGIGRAVLINAAITKMAAARTHTK